MPTFEAWLKRRFPFRVAGVDARGRHRPPSGHPLGRLRVPEQRPAEGQGPVSGHPDDRATRSASLARRARPQARLRQGRSRELGITHSCTQSLSFEDCMIASKVAKIAGSLRVQSSAPSCNLRERPRCLATTRYDRNNHQNRRNPLDQPSVNRFPTRTCWSRTHRQFFFEAPRLSPPDRGGRHPLT
jgi:hypothetical protein